MDTDKDAETGGVCKPDSNPKSPEAMPRLPSDIPSSAVLDYGEQAKLKDNAKHKPFRGFKSVHKLATSQKSEVSTPRTAQTPANEISLSPYVSMTKRALESLWTYSRSTRMHACYRRHNGSPCLQLLPCRRGGATCDYLQHQDRYPSQPSLLVRSGPSHYKARQYAYARSP